MESLQPPVYDIRKKRPIRYTSHSKVLSPIATHCNHGTRTLQFVSPGYRPMMTELSNRRHTLQLLRQLPHNSRPETIHGFRNTTSPRQRPRSPHLRKPMPSKRETPSTTFSSILRPSKSPAHFPRAQPLPRRNRRGAPCYQCLQEAPERARTKTPTENAPRDYT